MRLSRFLVLLFLFGMVTAQGQEEKGTPAPHKYGYEAQSGKKKGSEEETPKSKNTKKKSSSTSSTKAKSSKKKTVDSDEEDAPVKPKASPSPKKTTPVVEEDDESKIVPTPSPSPSPSTDSTSGTTHPNSAPNASLSSDDLVEFSKQPAKVQKLIESALALTRLNLTYTYGSSDPANGGMDCSGFVYYVLRQNGITDVPRDASGQYVWVRKAKKFEAVFSRKKDSFELEDLKPGDLLFWTGTYSIEKDPPITHAMIFLGTEKGTHKPVMVGSTDGRTYNGKSRWGVSVFDFKANSQPPQTDLRKQTRAAFIGYGSIPGLKD